MKDTVHKTKVLWLIKGLAVGGAEKLLVTSVPYLNRSRFDYQVAYFLPNRADLVPEFERAGIPVSCLNIEKDFDPGAILKIRRLLREKEIEILHIHSPHAGVLGRIAAQFSTVKSIVYTEHMPVERQKYLAQLGNLLTYPLNDSTITVSDAVLHSVLGRQVIKHGTFLTIHNGIDLNAVKNMRAHRTRAKINLGIPENYSIVGNVANLLPAKGHSDLIQAAFQVIQQYPNVVFVIVGKEGQKEDMIRLQDLAQSLGIQDKVIFTGYRSDVFQLMNDFDIFVLPSLWEGLGIVLLEAMAFGKPVIGTNVGGIPEVIDDGQNGFLVSPHNPQQLAEKILLLLNDKPLRDQMGQNGMKKVANKFNIQQTVKKTEEVYSTLLNSRKYAEKPNGMYVYKSS